MNFLLNSPSEIHLIRGADWRTRATPTTALHLTLKFEHNSDGHDRNPIAAPAPGKCCDIALCPSGDWPASGSLLLFLPFPALREAAAADIFAVDGGEWAWHWPLLEVNLPCRGVTLKQFSIPEQPGAIVFESYCRSPEDRFLRLPEVELASGDCPAESIQVRLSSNFSGGLLRYAIAAEQGEKQHFMLDRQCRDEVALECCGQNRVFRLNGGLAVGTISLPADKAFTAKAFHLGLNGAESNLVDPAFAADLPYRLYWGDMHVHSRESDGCGEPETVLARARDWQRLDFLAFNEHIENNLCWRVWSPEKWQKLKQLYDRSTVDGEFVVIPGFEYHSYCNLWCFSDAYLDFFGPEINRDEAHRMVGLNKPGWIPQEAAVQHRIASLAADPDWLVGYHRLELLKAEQGGLPTPVHLLQMAHYKRPPEVGSADYLRRGDRVGFFGSTDTHIGLPGMGFKGDRTAPSGLTAVYAEELSRDGIHRALRQRRCYATMGSRTLLDVRLNDALMGSEITVPDGAPMELKVRAAGQERLVGMDIVVDGENQASFELNGKFVEHTWRTGKAGSRSGFVFVRLHLEDGRMVWSSPIWCV